MRNIMGSGGFHGCLSETKGVSARGRKQHKTEAYTLFFYKNVASPAQAAYSYFSAGFRLKIFLYYS